MLLQLCGLMLLLTSSGVLGSVCAQSCEAVDCPCKCFKDEVRCDNQQLQRIVKLPKHQHVLSIDFSFNNITNISKHQLAKPYLLKVKYLRLSSNKISRVPAGTFSRLRNLTSLFLNHNQIRQIDKNAFKRCKKLKRLYLNHNQISNIDELAFAPLVQSVELIYLQKNKIQHISDNLFNNMIQLRVLDLSYNELLQINMNIFYKVNSLKFMFLSNNPWSCMSEQECQTMTSQSTIIISGFSCNFTNSRNKENCTTTNVISGYRTFKSNNDWIFFILICVKILHQIVF